MQVKMVVKKVLHKGLIKQYKKQLHKQTISYEDYVAKLEEAYVRELETDADFDEKAVQVLLYPEVNNTFSLDGIDAEYLLFSPMDGAVSKLAKRAVYHYFKEHPGCDFLYGDEDSVDTEGKRNNPYWKPDWSPTEYVDSFYIYGVFAVRKSVIRDADFLRSDNWLKNIVYLCDNILKRLGGFEKRSCKNSKIGHIPYVLFHRMNHNKRAKWKKLTQECVTDEEKAVVSVIILSKDNYAVVRSNIETIMHYEKGCTYEIILVDNGSCAETRELLESYCKKKDITYIYEKREFNFSVLCNLGAEAAKGNYLLFMNDDVEACQINFMESMLEEAGKLYVGAVGCKLLYPGTTKIQHAGITNLAIGPMHKLQFEKDNKEHYFGRNWKKINAIAVTAACLMIEKKKFVEVGGFPCELAVAYNDVALGFALEKAGYYNVCLNDLGLYHHESLSRGCDDSLEKMERLLEEQKKLYEMFPEFMGVDPYYSVRLAQDISDQRMEMKLVADEEARVAGSTLLPIKNAETPCENQAVFVTIEWISQENNGMIISGYTFVSGLDNATLHRELWLMPEKNSDNPQKAYKIKLNRCLRSDVARNLPDQRNVELCGFSVEVKTEDVKPGKYIVWVMQKERFGRLRLFRKTNRSIVVE